MKKLKQFISWLIIGFIFLLPLQTRLIYKQGILNAGVWEYGTFSLYATELLFFVILALTIVYCIKLVTANNALNKNYWRRLLPLVAVALIMAVNIFLSQSQSIAFYKLGQLIEATALFFIILIIKPEFQRISWAIVLSGLVQSVSAIEQFIDQKVIANKWLGMASQSPEILGTPIVQLDGVRWLRTFGTFSHPNMLAGFLVVGLILIIGLYASANKEKIKKYLSLIFVINSVALFTTLSRAALIAMFFSIILFAFLSRKDQLLNKTVTKFALIFIFIAIVFSATYPELIFSRTFSGNRVENISNTTRIEQYKEYWPIIKNNWLTGVGLGNYTAELFATNPTREAWLYQPIHNTYLLIFAELGIFGFILILSIIFYVFYLARGTLTCHYEPVSRLTCLACLAGLAGLACLALFDHYLWSFYSGIILTSIILASQEQKTI